MTNQSEKLIQLGPAPKKKSACHLNHPGRKDRGMFNSIWVPNNLTQRKEKPPAVLLGRKFFLLASLKM